MLFEPVGYLFEPSGFIEGPGDAFFVGVRDLGLLVGEVVFIFDLSLWPCGGMSLCAKLSRDRVHPVIKKSSCGRVLHGPVWKARRIDGHAYIGAAVGSGNESASHSGGLPATPEPAVGGHRDEHHVVAKHESSNARRKPTAEPSSWNVDPQRAQVRANCTPGDTDGCWRAKCTFLAWLGH